MNGRLALRIGVTAGIVSAALPSVPTILANRDNPEYMRNVWIMALVAGVAVLLLWGKE